jgi:hypothetical protein
MKDKIDKINIEHLLVLKHKPNSKEIYIDFENIDTIHNFKINQIKTLCDDQSVQLYQIKNFLLNLKDSDEYNGYHHYCVSLSSAYEGFTVNVQETILSIDKKQNELNEKRKANESFDYNKELNEFKESLKKKIVLWFVSDALKRTYKKLEKEKLNIVYSHRIPGWTKPAYQIHPIFSFQLKTNFGYGHVSYFYTKLKFKDLEIVPFTDWINYRYARIFEIVSYSSNHPLKNESWYDAINYVFEAYNVFLKSEYDFIKKYIVDECNNFIEGLRKIFNHCADKIKLIEGHHFFNPEKKYVDLKIKGHNLVEFKGEKISGALKFIDLMSKFQTVTEVENFINQIEKLNREILPILTNEVNDIDKELLILQNELLELQPIYDKYKKENENYLELKSKLGDEICANKEFTNVFELNKEINNQFKIKYPEYDAFKIKYDEVVQKYNKIKSDIADLERIKKNILNYFTEIENYFNKEKK